MEEVESLRETLGLPKNIHFKVKGWTIFSVHFGDIPTNEYFSTIVENRAGIGQFQAEALEGYECGLARAFWLKYSIYNNKSLDKIPLEMLHAMKKDLEILKENYSHALYKCDTKSDRKFKAKDIGSLVDSGMSLTEIMERLNLHKILDKELDSKVESNKKMKI